jgi:hypothetical protein
MENSRYIHAREDTRLGEAGDLSIIQETKPLVAIQPATVDADALLVRMRKVCEASLPEGADIDGNPEYELFGTGKKAMSRFKHAYQVWRFVENWFGDDIDSPEHMAVVQQIIRGQYGFCDHIGASDIISSAQDAAVDEAQVLSAIVLDTTLTREVYREEGAPIPFTAI